MYTHCFLVINSISCKLYCRSKSGGQYQVHFTLLHLQAICTDGYCYCNTITFDILSTFSPLGISLLENCLLTYTKRVILFSTLLGLAITSHRNRCFYPSPTRSNIKNYPGISTHPNQPQADTTPYSESDATTA